MKSKTRATAILLALLLLVGVVGFSSFLSGAIGVPPVGPGTPPPTTAVPTPDESQGGDPGSDGSAPGGTEPEGTHPPGTTPTVYIDQDSGNISGAWPATPTYTLPATTVTTPRPSATDETVDKEKEKEKTHAPSGEDEVTVPMQVVNETYSPSTITVRAGTKVTVTFDNQDVGTGHSLVIYRDMTMTSPVFIGKGIVGPDQITYTFTAPLELGRYVIGCGIPYPHPKGVLVVE